MKTKEKAVTNYVREKHNQDECVGFIDGYEKCQQDMIDTLEMRILINEHDWNRNPQAQLRDFIESLNKQE